MLKSGSCPGRGRIPNQTFMFLSSWSTWIKQPVFKYLKFPFPLKKVLWYNLYTIKANTLTYYHLQIFDKCILWCKCYHNKKRRQCLNVQKCSLGVFAIRLLPPLLYPGNHRHISVEQLCHFQKSIDMKSYTMQPSVSGFSHLHS